MKININVYVNIIINARFLVVVGFVFNAKVLCCHGKRFTIATRDPSITVKKISNIRRNIAF